MSIQNITYGDKVDLDTSQVADINKVSASDLNAIKSVVNNNANFIGKTLWEGSFSTGTLSVPGISEYSIIVVYVGGVAMIGNQSYGGTIFRTYNNITHSSYAYRFTYSSANETLTTSTENPGASDGTNQLTITKIVGVF